MKKILLIAAIVFCATLLPRPVFAHELIRDTNMTSGMVFHIDPDDDPKPSAPSTLFFDLPGVPLHQKFSATLSVFSPNRKESSTIPLTINDNSASAKYTFPTAGTYHFSLVVNVQDKASVYQFSQKIASPESTTAKPQSQTVALIALAIGIVAFIAVIVVAVLRRKRIAKQS